jgi:L-alanine-DL-glutamate epimerase-like enolase superfamily enzyme
MLKREFIKMSALFGGAMLTGNARPVIDDAKKKSKKVNLKGEPMKLKFVPYDLQLKHVFTIANNSRTTTPVVLTRIDYEGFSGFGEASMPPYLGESHETVLKFLSQVDLTRFKDPFLTVDIIQYIDSISPGNYSAKASVDIALHDLIGKLIGKPWFRIWGLDPLKTPNTSFTIGIDTPDMVRQKVAEAEPYKVLKVKLGAGNDKEMFEVIRNATVKPICVDANQGWKDKQYALEMAEWLKERNVLFIEQPMAKTMVDDIGWLTQRSPLPIIADEAVQGIKDLIGLKGIYSGINIKLMKCGGMSAAYKMAQMAIAMDMKVMIGCMTETSCAISAASQLSPLAKWADLDGNLLIKNDCFEGVTVVDGKIVLNEKAGLGINETIKMFP